MSVHACAQASLSRLCLLVRGLITIETARCGPLNNMNVRNDSGSHLASLQTEKGTRRIDTCISVTTWSQGSSRYTVYLSAASIAMHDWVWRVPTSGVRCRLE